MCDVNPAGVSLPDLSASDKNHNKPMMTRMIDGATMEVTTMCPFCKAKQTLKVNPKAFSRWRKGLLIQDAFPKLTPDEREALITGICSECFPS